MRWFGTLPLLALPAMLFAACSQICGPPVAPEVDKPAEERTVSFASAGVRGAAPPEDNVTDFNNIVSDGFAVTGRSEGEVIMKDYAYFDSTGLFRTSGKHNIPYGSDVEFFAVYPKEVDIIAEESKVFFNYDSELHGQDIVVAGPERHTYSSSAQDGPVQMEFRHVLSGLILNVRGQNAGEGFCLRSLSVLASENGIYDFITDDWSSLTPASPQNVFCDGRLMYFIPSRIRLQAGWSCIHNGVETAVYCAGTDIILEKGFITAVTLVLSDTESTPVSFLVEVEPWKSADKDAVFIRADDCKTCP